MKRLLYLFLSLLSFCSDGQMMSISNGSKAIVLNPTVRLSNSTVNVISTFTETFTCSNVVSGFTSADIICGHCTLSALSTSDNIVFTATVTPDYINSCTFNIAPGGFTDLSGNPNLEASATVALYPDWKNPTSTWADYATPRAFLAAVTTQNTTLTFHTGENTTMYGEGTVNQPDGKAFWCNGRVVFTPSTDTYVLNGAHVDYNLGALAPNGKIYMPGAQSNGIYVWDTSNSTGYTLAAGLLPSPHGGVNFYWGACLTYLGSQPIIICAPTDAGAFLIIKPNSVAGSITGDSYYLIGASDPNISMAVACSAIIEAPDSRYVVAVPSATTYIPVIDKNIVDGSGNLTDASITYPFNRVQTSTPPAGLGWGGASNALDNDTYFSPYSRHSFLKLHWATWTATEFGTTELNAISGTMRAIAFRGITLDARGKLICIPQHEERWAEVTPGVTPTVIMTTPPGDPWNIGDVTITKNVGVTLMSDLRIISSSYVVWKAGNATFATLGVSQGLADPNLWLSRFSNRGQ